MGNIIEKSENYEIIVDNIRSIIKESINQSRMILVEGYWNAGKLLREEFGNDITKLLQGLAVDIGISERTLWYALKFYDKFPNFDLVPEGKNISWNKLITLYLPEPKKAETPEPPKGKWQVLYIDPPWAYDVDLSEGATRSPTNNYPVMDLEELKKFGEIVKCVSTSNCTLFMWITAPKLNWMNDVLAAWGFDYKTNLIWDKVKPNMGHYSSVRHEILIIAGKGKCAPTCDGKTIQSVDSVVSIEKSTRHSEKPLEFMDIIDKLYPKYKKLEMFARNKGQRKNWSYWGQEALTNDKK